VVEFLSIANTPKAIVPSAFPKSFCDTAMIIPNEVEQIDGLTQDCLSNVRLPQVLVGICSCRKNSNHRKAVRETWFPVDVPGISARFFVGSGECPEEPDTVGLDVPDDYEHLPIKVLQFFRYALAHFEFDWLFKCDDDTYLAADRLH
jgi:hypothetical protein